MSLDLQPLEKKTTSIADYGYTNSKTCENTELWFMVIQLLNTETEKWLQRGGKSLTIAVQ